MFDSDAKELTRFDEQLNPVLEKAQNETVQTQQLALDATRLLYCTADRFDVYSNKGFFKRCWYALSGKTGEIQRANQSDLIEMQKIGWRYLNLLQERDLMTAHSILTVKNNLLTLAVTEEETRRSITEMAEKVGSRFSALEDRMGTLEVATNIHGWLLTLETMDYDEKFPRFLRLLKIIREFHSLKPDDWNLQEIKYLQKAISVVALNPKQKITIQEFIDTIIDEVYHSSFESFSNLVRIPGNGDGTSIPPLFILEQISVPSYSSLALIDLEYHGSSRVIDTIACDLTVEPKDALKKVLFGFITQEGIDTTVALPLRDLAVEILTCMGLTTGLYGLQATHNEPRPKVQPRTAHAIADSPGSGKELEHEDVQSEETAELSIEKIKNAARRSDARGQFLLGCALVKGNEVEQNVEEGVRWIQMSASQKYSEALYWMAGHFNESGKHAECVDYLRQASKLNHADSLYCLGKYYWYGYCVDKDQQEALRLLEEARGYDSWEACIHLAFCHFFGDGVQKDRESARTLFAEGERKAGKDVDFETQLAHKLVEKNLYGSPGTNCFSGSDIPDKKRKKAIGSYAPEIDEDMVVLLIDETFLGSAKDGILLTKEQIHGKNKGNTVRFPISRIDKVNASDKTLIVNDLQCYSFVYTDKDTVSRLANLLEDMVQFAKWRGNADNGSKPM